jgi:SAM-dependent methyltransferase
MTAPYAEPLAVIQARAFGGFAGAAASEVITLLAAHGLRGGRLVDVGCGAGESTTRFLEAGFEVCALEPSRPLRRIARERAPGASYPEDADAYTARLPAADVIVALGEPLTYHAPHEDARARLEGFFTEAARALPRGGRLLFDLIVIGEPALDGQGWASGEDWAILYRTSERAPDDASGDGFLRRDIETFLLTEGAWQRSRERHEVRVLREAWVAGALREAGFTVQIADRYGTCPLLPRRRAFNAVRA